MTTIDSSRLRGAWMGLAIGNALGGPLESLWRNQIQIKLGTVTDMIGGGWLDLRPGETTTDIAVAGALAAFLEKTAGHGDRSDLLRAYHEACPLDALDVSRTLRDALSRFEDGLDVERIARESAAAPASDLETPEILTRACVFGMHQGEDPALAARGAGEDASLTHGPKDAATAASNTAIWIASALRASSLRESLEQAHEAVQRTEGLADVLPSLEEPVDPEHVASDPSASEILQLVGAELLRGGTFEEVLIRVVNHGGASEVSGALTGALLGALLGDEALPERWLARMSARGSWERRGHFLWSSEEG